MLQPHETIAWMRAYHTALDLVRLDVEAAQHAELDAGRLDEITRTLRRRDAKISAEEVESRAYEQNDRDLTTLIRFTEEIDAFQAQLDQVIVTPSLFRSFVNDRQHYWRMRSILRKALHRDSLELGWLFTRTTEDDCPSELQDRTQELIHRIAVFSRALYFTPGKIFYPLPINMVFSHTDPP